jgi:hypothetical protein
VECWVTWFIVALPSALRPSERKLQGEQQTNESDEQGPKLIGFIPPAAIAADAPGW